MNIKSDQLLWARLSYLELGSEDPRRLANWYAAVFGMEVESRDSSYFCRGSSRVIVISPGRAKSVIAAGYALRDDAALSALMVRLNHAGINVAGSRNLSTAVTFRDPSGNLFEFGLPPMAPSVNKALPGRLQHVVFASDRAQEMVEFFTHVVGFRESDRVLDDAGKLRTSFMRSDNEHHSLAFFQAQECRLDHHCYEAADWAAIRDWGDHFASHNISVEWGPGRHGPGNNLFLFVYDVDGNWLEISAELEVVKGDHATGVWKHEERTLNSWGKAYLRE